MDAAAIAAIGNPVLCIDTCSLLDLMRDPTRDTATPGDRQAGHDLVAAAEAGDLTILMAEQVRTEFEAHDAAIQAEAGDKIRKLQDQVRRIHQLVGVYGAVGTLDLRHLDDHVVRARALVDRWLLASTVVKPSGGAFEKAFTRVNAMRAPAARAKDSSKDCLIFETYLEAIGAIRQANSRAPIVFLSSNTKDYLTEARILKADIATDLTPLNAQFTAGQQHAKHTLGL